MPADIKYRNIDVAPQYRALQEGAAAPRATLERAHILERDLPFVKGARYNYAARLLGKRELQTLCALAEHMEVIPKYEALTAGEYMNLSEGRMVLHHLLRGVLHEGAAAITDRNGKRMADFYQQERQKIYDFARRVRSGAFSPDIDGTGASRFEAVVQIGIGGSELGPRALYEALKGWAAREGISPLLPAHFISNVDPDDALSVLSRVPPRSTLFILVSKSGGTIETLTNAALVSAFLKAHGVTNPKRHMVVVTAQGSPLARDADYAAHFLIDDHIGGRYSSSGAVGAVLLSVAFGPAVFDSLLEGAHQADQRARQRDPLRNPALLDALCGVYERTFLGYPAYGVLPYSQALHRFPAHIQQLDMESNGKAVNRLGEPVSYQTGAIAFGEPGTNGQHSFYQLLHQGSSIIPAIFIAFDEAQGMGDETRGGEAGNGEARGGETHDGETNDGEAAPAIPLRRSQEILRANVMAQVAALAYGEDNADANKRFAGGRPSSLLYARRLTPFTLGALLSFFENRVMFQGFLWNLNSFDQEGVQLGKRLASAALEERAETNADADSETSADTDTETGADADNSSIGALRQYTRLFSRLTK